MLSAASSVCGELVVPEHPDVAAEDRIEGAEAGGWVLGVTDEETDACCVDGVGWEVEQIDGPAVAVDVG